MCPPSFGNVPSTLSSTPPDVYQQLNVDNGEGGPWGGYGGVPTVGEGVWGVPITPPGPLFFLAGNMTDINDNRYGGAQRWGPGAGPGPR